MFAIGLLCLAIFGRGANEDRGYFLAVAATVFVERHFLVQLDQVRFLGVSFVA